MNRIYEWYVKSFGENMYSIKGVLETGGKSVTIRTELIKAALYDRKSGVIIITVKSGSMYTVYTDDMYIGRRCYPPQDWVDDIHSQREQVLRDFCRYYGFDELADKIIFVKNEKIKRLEENFDSIAKRLPTNTIYLALKDNGYHFRYALCNDNGKTVNCDMRRSEEYGDVICVYSSDDQIRFPLLSYSVSEDNAVSFIDTSSFVFRKHCNIEDGRLLGYLYNSGVAPLLISFSWGGKAEIKPNQEIEVRYGM